MKQIVKVLPQVVEECNECPFRLYHPKEPDLCTYGPKSGTIFAPLTGNHIIPDWCPLDDV